MTVSFNRSEIVLEMYLYISTYILLDSRLDVHAAMPDENGILSK